VPVKRAPLTVPSPTIAVEASQNGIVTLTKPPPCRTADSTIGPKISPPGNPIRNRPNAAAKQPPTSSANCSGASAMESAPVGSRAGPAIPSTAERKSRLRLA
jgi:hypothetical protein